MSITLSGIDNSGQARQIYADRISAMTDAELLKETENVIWLSAYANNNPRSDYHWQADACYSECSSRGKDEIYSKAYETAKARSGG